MVHHYYSIITLIPFNTSISDRYMYVPLGGRKYALFNVWPIFTFVALWHDLSMKLFAWGWLICLFLLPEVLASLASKKLDASEL
jgi:D-alanyl-lipoteichoic acid acyltransferase DltB (MBOAT superfamily)